jgi:Pvc16 N-terminal domain
MISKAMTFIKNEVNQYLVLRTGSPPGVEKVVLSNIVDVNENENLPENMMICSMIFIEEEKIHKAQDQYVRSSSGSISMVNPPIKLNLFVIFAAHFTNANYTEALKQLSYTISFFQGRSVFDSKDYPLLDTEIERLVVELYTMPMDQQSQLWQSFGGKFLPSVMYKIRMLTIDERAVLQEVPRVESIDTK